MHTRLTPKGRSAVRILAKLIAVGVVIVVGMDALAAAGRYLTAPGPNMHEVVSSPMIPPVLTEYTAPVQYRPTAALPFTPQPIFPVVPVASVGHVAPVAPFAFHPLRPACTVEPMAPQSFQQNGITWYVYGSPPVSPLTQCPRYPSYPYRSYGNYQRVYFFNQCRVAHPFSARRR